jgi:hypothetical protein
VSQFMLLLYDDPSQWAKLGPEDMQKAIEKYMAWSKKPFTVDSNSAKIPVSHPIAGRPAAHDGRALQRDQGSARRLLHHRSRQL